MIQAKISNKGTEMSVMGDFQTIVTESIKLISAVHDALKKSEDSGEVAEAYAHLVTRAFADGVVFCDDKDRNKVLENLRRENEKSMKELREIAAQERKEVETMLTEMLESGDPKAVEMANKAKELLELMGDNLDSSDAQREIKRLEKKMFGDKKK